MSKEDKRTALKKIIDLLSDAMVEKLLKISADVVMLEISGVNVAGMFDQKWKLNKN